MRRRREVVVRGPMGLRGLLLVQIRRGGFLGVLVWDLEGGLRWLGGVWVGGRRMRMRIYEL